MDRRETERFLDALREMRAAGEPAAVATVVRVHGSAYRREGTRMLVRQDGTYECALSGGCLEPAVAAAAARVLATGEPALVHYDLADDSVWGLNIGCTGAVDIRIERAGDDAVMAAWLAALERDEAAALLTPLTGATGRRVVFASGTATGRLSDATIEREADARARGRLMADEARSGSEAIGDAEVFVDVHLPAPRLVIFGGGHDAAPVAGQAWRLGFRVTVVDSREAYLRADRFPDATLVLAPYDDLPSALSLEPGSFVVVMNHHLDRDRQALGFALASGARYIGVLGPRARFERLLERLRQDGEVPLETGPSRVHSPVGLALGAETPEEVAVSILAEILATRRGFDGGFLRSADRSLHQPAATRLLARS
jgi:xanthine/CO dehydrogenase XdhC/CoxF family maturation factor